MVWQAVLQQGHTPLEGADLQLESAAAWGAFAGVSPLLSQAELAAVTPTLVVTQLDDGNTLYIGKFRYFSEDKFSRLMQDNSDAILYIFPWE